MWGTSSYKFHQKEWDYRFGNNKKNYIQTRSRCGDYQMFYLDFDEDGGASDGIEDSIDYEVEDVLEALESLILKLRDELDDEQNLVASIKTIIEKCE